MPGEIAAVVELSPGDRALAWATDDAGRHIVATEQALILQRNPPAYESIGWEAIDQASYADGVMSLTLVPEFDGTANRLRVPIGDALDLPIAVRDRVTASIVVNQHVPLNGRKGLRVVARRRTGEPELRWGYVLDTGVEDDEHLRSRAAGLVEQVRRESGLD